MTENIYDFLSYCEKSYYTTKVEELYCDLVKQSINATIGVVDEYIEFFSDETIQAMYSDMTIVEVLELLRKTLITGEYPTKIRDDVDD